MSATALSALASALMVSIGLSTAAAGQRDKAVETVAGMPVTQERIDAQLADTDAEARQAARDEALLHRAALAAGAGLDERYHPLVAPRVHAGGRSLSKRAARSAGHRVDKDWLRSAGLKKRDLPAGTRIGQLEPGVAIQAGDHRLPVADATETASSMQWLDTHHQAAAARLVLAAGAPEAREAVVGDWLEEQFSSLIETEDLVPSRLRQWYDAHRTEFPEERLWVRTLHSRDAGERQRAQLLVFHAHIGMDPSRFPVYARMMHKDDPEAGEVVGPIRPGDPGPLAPDLAARILSLGETGLSPVITMDDQLWVVLVERREGGFPEVAGRVEERVRNEALERRTQDLLATLRTAPIAEASPSAP